MHFLKARRIEQKNNRSGRISRHREILSELFDFKQEQVPRDMVFKGRLTAECNAVTN